MSEAAKAVFLSYAREDADAARRVADALRAFGVEVWFDQSELRGGDAWDQKIRGQIRTCALFLPIISGRTQKRHEGYFRREWKLAVERTHDMAAGVAFIVPIVIDGTSEGEAMVPDEFMRVQWTRLAHGVPTTQFVEQVKRLLEAGPSAASSKPATDGGRGHQTPPSQSPFTLAGSGVPAIQHSKPHVPAWAWAALAVLGLVIGGTFALHRAVPPAADSKPQTRDSKLKSPSSKSIAVLPFANFSTERENEYFADGVQDDVITALAKIHDLTVISRTSTLAYRDPGTRNLKKIAAELGVATVLEGSVARVGSKVHMNAQLIDARTDAHLWAETFDGDASDIFALQASLAQKIAGALQATLTTSERTLIERRPTQNQRAYELYLRARAMQQELGESGSAVADYERVIAAYDLALAEDPHFALAYAQVAVVNSILYWFGNLDPSPARHARMKAAVDLALRYAPDAPETHLAVGAYHYRVELDWAGALAEFRVAETSLPNDAQLAFWQAIAHRRLGHWTESIREFERAATLDPRDLATVGNYTSFLVALRRWDQAREVSARYSAYFPNDRSLKLASALSRFAVDGDRVALADALENLPSSPADPDARAGKFEAALARDDLDMAKRLLVNMPDPAPTLVSGVINDSSALQLAGVAYLAGDAAAAARYGRQAIAYYEGKTWNTRQTPWVHMRIAEAMAWAGQTDGAVTRARAALNESAAQDAFDAAASLRPIFGIVLVAAGHRDEALACLREMMQSPCLQSPNAVRIDPFWSRVKDDPRFEEILKSAKPL